MLHVVATTAGERSVTTPWGRAKVIDEIRLSQRAGEEQFASLVQLLEGPQGGRLVRFAYTTDGVVRRGPVTLQAKDVAKLLATLPKHPELAAALGLGGGA
jgi:hypothetical protein